MFLLLLLGEVEGMVLSAGVLLLLGEVEPVAAVLEADFLEGVLSEEGWWEEAAAEVWPGW